MTYTIEPVAAEAATSALPIVDQDQTCVGCGYNLRGLPTNGKCPECGKPVEFSLRGFLLKFAAPEYLAVVHNGVFLIQAAIIALLLTTFIGIGLGVAAATGSAGTVFPNMAGLELAASVINLIFYAMSVLGYWRFTQPDLGYLGQEQPNSPRKLIRLSIAVLVGTQLVTFCMELLPRSTTGFGLVGAVSLFVGLCYLVFWVVQFINMMRYVRWLATRIPDEDIIKKTKRYTWLLPVLWTVGILLIGLGPLIALVLYWNLLDRIRKHLKAIRAEANGGILMAAGSPS